MIGGLVNRLCDLLGTNAIDPVTELLFGGRNIHLSTFVGLPGFARIGGEIIELKGRTVAEVLEEKKKAGRSTLI